MPAGDFCLDISASPQSLHVQSMKVTSFPKTLFHVSTYVAVLLTFPYSIRLENLLIYFSSFHIHSSSGDSSTGSPPLHAHDPSLYHTKLISQAACFSSHPLCSTPQCSNHCFITLQKATGDTLYFITWPWNDGWPLRPSAVWPFASSWCLVLPVCLLTIK